jgi:hypothetical protein
MQRMRSYRFYNFRFRLSLVYLASNLETESTMHVGRFYSKPEMHARGQPEPARLAERLRSDYSLAYLLFDLMGWELRTSVEIKLQLDFDPITTC